MIRLSIDARQAHGAALSLIWCAVKNCRYVPVFEPFNITDDHDYQIWRALKLQDYPTSLQDLMVQVNDPRALTRVEHDALLACCKKTNFAIYISKHAEADKDIPVMLGRQFGLQRLDHNWLADEDAVTSLTVNPAGDHPAYIPYTNRPIKWHTDGYYNGADAQIHGLLLHCVQPAEQGGANRLLDHEIAYIKLRDIHPDLVRVLMQPDAMTIPERLDEQGVARPAVSGPVFSVHRDSGSLHMRYTARSRSIQWKNDALTQQAVSCLQDILESDLPYIFSATLQPGMGLLSNNILHDRAAFSDGSGPPRLLYRARYLDRIHGTSPGVE